MRAIMQWVVQPGDGATVAEIVAQMGAAGRAFLNGRPASSDDEVEPGDRVELYPHRAIDTRGVSILAQRDGVVLAFKPAGIPTETTQAGRDSVVSELLRRLKGGRVHAATRLDVAVSGVVACTLGRDAARRMVDWRGRGLVRRTYLAIAQGALSSEGRVEIPLGKQRDRGGRVRAVRDGSGLREARTRFERLATAPTATLLRLTPETGRMHQLRAHAAFSGAPLFGDALYGGPRNLVLDDGRVVSVARIALHAVTVELPHLAARAPLPDDLIALWRDLGGVALDPLSGEPA